MNDLISFTPVVPTDVRVDRPNGPSAPSPPSSSGTKMETGRSNSGFAPRELETQPDTFGRVPSSLFTMGQGNKSPEAPRQPTSPSQNQSSKLPPPHTNSSPESPSNLDLISFEVFQDPTVTYKNSHLVPLKSILKNPSSNFQLLSFNLEKPEGPNALPPTLPPDSSSSSSGTATPKTKVNSASVPLTLNPKLSSPKPDFTKVEEKSEPSSPIDKSKVKLSEKSELLESTAFETLKNKNPDLTSEHPNNNLHHLIHAQLKGLRMLTLLDKQAQHNYVDSELVPFLRKRKIELQDEYECEIKLENGEVRNSSAELIIPVKLGIYYKSKDLYFHVVENLIAPVLLGAHALSQLSITISPDRVEGVLGPSTGIILTTPLKILEHFTAASRAEMKRSIFLRNPYRFDKNENTEVLWDLNMFLPSELESLTRFEASRNERESSSCDTKSPSKHMPCNDANSSQYRCPCFTMPEDDEREVEPIPTYFSSSFPFIQTFLNGLELWTWLDFESDDNFIDHDLALDLEEANVKFSESTATVGAYAVIPISLNAHGPTKQFKFYTMKRLQLPVSLGKEALRQLGLTKLDPQSKANVGGHKPEISLGDSGINRKIPPSPPKLEKVKHEFSSPVTKSPDGSTGNLNNPTMVSTDLVKPDVVTLSEAQDEKLLQTVEKACQSFSDLNLNTEASQHLTPSDQLYPAELSSALAQPIPPPISRNRLEAPLTEPIPKNFPSPRPDLTRSGEEFRTSKDSEGEAESKLRQIVEKINSPGTKNSESEKIIKNDSEYEKTDKRLQDIKSENGNVMDPLPLDRREIRGQETGSSSTTDQATNIPFSDAPLPSPAPALKPPGIPSLARNLVKPFPLDRRKISEQVINVNPPVPLSPTPEVDSVSPEIQHTVEARVGMAEVEVLRTISSDIPKTTAEKIRHSLLITCHVFRENDLLRTAAENNAFVAETEKIENEFFASKPENDQEGKKFDVGTVARRKPDPDADPGIRRRRRNFYERAKLFAEEIKNEPKRIAGLLASRPKDPKWVAAVCKELKHLQVDRGKLTDALILEEKLSKSSASVLSSGLSEGIDLVVLKTELDERSTRINNEEDSSKLKDHLRCSALRCSVPAGLAADLIIREICPICYFEIRNSNEISKSNPRLHQTFVSKYKESTAKEWLADLSSSKLLELIAAYHEAECVD